MQIDKKVLEGRQHPRRVRKCHAETEKMHRSHCRQKPKKQKWSAITTQALRLKSLSDKLSSCWLNIYICVVFYFLVTTVTALAGCHNSTPCDFHIDADTCSHSNSINGGLKPWFQNSCFLPSPYPFNGSCVWSSAWPISQFLVQNQHVNARNVLMSC